jgi:hypothetical protein
VINTKRRPEEKDLYKMRWRMRVRDKPYSAYGLFEEEREAVETYCSSLDPYKERIIREAIRNSSIDLEEELYQSIVNKKSYMAQAEKNYIPIGEKDFYGYRRKAIRNIYDCLRLYG